MKTSIPIILTAVCVSGLLFSAAAQPTTGGTADQNGAAATPDQSVSPAGGANLNNTNAPDAGAPPPDATQGQPAQDQGAMNGPAPADQTEAAPAGNQPVESTVILPK